MTKYVFVIAPPRSGTTALTRLLSAHSEVCLADAKSLGTSRDEKETWESGIFVRKLTDEDVKERFHSISDGYAAVVEKTPSHVFKIDRIRKLFPEALFLVIHRAPRASMLSWKVAVRTFIESKISFKDACKRWASATDVCSSHFGDPNFLFIEYSEFINKADQEAGRVFDFIGLDCSEIKRCVDRMQDKSLERVRGVVGESIRGGKTKLSFREGFVVLKYCLLADLRYRIKFK